MVIDDTLYKVMRIQCLWIRLSKESEMYKDPIDKQLAQQVDSSLSLVVKLLQTENTLRKKKHKKPR